MDLEYTIQTREHLETAYIRDLPVGLTLFFEPKLLGRRPITYKSMFRYLYEQQVYREIQGVPPLQYRNLNDSTQSQLHGKLRSWLQMAAGKDRPPNVDTRVRSKDEVDAENDDDNGGGSSSGFSHTKGSLQDDEIGEAQERLFKYFFSRTSRHPTSYPLRGSTSSGIGGGGKGISSHSTDRPPPHSQTGGSGPQGTSQVDGGLTTASQMPAIFFGMRQIPPHAPDYLTTLYEWAVYFTVAHDRHHHIPLPNTAVNTPKALTVEGMPEYIKNILRMAKPMLLFPPRNTTVEDDDSEDGGGDNVNGGEARPITSTAAGASASAHCGAQSTGANSTATVGGTGGVVIPPSSRDGVMGVTCTLEEYVYNPVVLSKVSGVMNSLVPPRLLVFFDIDPKLVEKQYRNRERRQRKIEALVQENATHPGNERLLRELQEERELQRTEDPVVGEAMLLIEPPSMSQSTRMDLLALEKEVDMHLRNSGSRCWGLPLRMNTHSPDLLSGGDGGGGGVSSNRTGGGKACKKRKDRETATEIIRQEAGPYLTSGKGTTGGGISSASGIGASTLSPPLNSATATGPSGGGGTSSSAASAGGAASPLFYNTICTGAALPSTLTKDAGGTATVSTTLNLVELNRERNGIYLHFLGEEVLRQVVLDLPERGVLLSRLLNEATLSLRTYEVVLQESVLHSGKMLMIGEKERKVALERISYLEAEVKALKKKKEAMMERKRTLQDVFEHRKALEQVKIQQERKFQETLLERLRAHAEVVKEMQDRERRGSLQEE